MTFWQFVSDNKVKFLGSATTLVAFFMGAIALGQFGPTADSPALLDPLTVRWLSIILGALNVLLGGGTVVAGFSNSSKVRIEEARADTASSMQAAILAPPPRPAFSQPPPYKAEGGFVKLRFLPVLMLFAVLVACMGTKELYQLAETPPQYAKAVLVHHNALGEAAARITSDPSVSQATKDAVRAAYRKTVCSAEEATVSIANCAHGPAYQLDLAIKGYEGVKNAQTQAELTTAVSTFVPLVTVLMNLVNKLIKVSP